MKKTDRKIEVVHQKEEKPIDLKHIAIAIAQQYLKGGENNNDR